MSFVDDLIEHSSGAPDIVYHYTRPDGLRKILEQKRVWATSVFHVNDTQEIKYTIKILQDVIAKRLKGGDTLEQRLLQPIATVGGPTIEQYPFGVACFSERGDQLSQWRAYGGAYGGFSIGFDAGWLQEVSADQCGGPLWRCIYSKKIQRDLLKALIMEACDEFVGKWDDTDEKDRKKLLHHSVSQTLSMVAMAASAFKHSSFREEKEWRIVSKLLGAEEAPVSFRETRNTLVPYTEIDISEYGESEKHIGVRKIVVGPTPHPKEAERTVELLCSSTGYEGVEIEITSCPYRAW